ncbi:LON peptidase substrate-binding domain-containing protein [Sedimentitalea todarodis]|uniref:LON peptidase substrate-binding domain-containing protein n=1 Tax=Sedimentitalea todarodis TaxID=1631240 RepID=A0ABU3VG11_9RHOB|nr:LON peptidase substrate-binding domain-containing protein [Sedimentitalea todarodis]MDU9005116.1 LON peptidase substrate-binding domain-containing protein [Sedimentitalea todarodis]
MLRAADLPDTLAVFPLPGALLLPRSRLPLHIFEPRYLQMFEDALKTPQRLIGMVQPNPLPGSQGAVHSIGCAGRVTQFSETEDGRYMITLTGVSRFRTKVENEGFCPYRRFEITWDGFDRDLGPIESDEGLDRVRFLDLLDRYFSTQQLSTDWETIKEAEDELLINSLSMLLNFGPEEKQALLEARSLETRRETLVTLIEYALRGGGEHKELLQ